MEINKNNYFSFINEVGIDKLPDPMKNGYELVNRATKGGSDWSGYNTFKKAIDLHFTAIGMWYDESKKKHSAPVTKNEEEKEQAKPKEHRVYPTHKPEKQSKPKEKKVQSQKSGGEGNNHPKKPKPFEKPKVKGKGVELISPETTFIRRYVSLHNKTKTKDQIGSFIRSLQKAIVERRIRKTSRHANLIREIQTQLVTAYKKMGNQTSFEFQPKDLNRYYKIAGAEIVMPSIRFIKAFLGLKGKEITKHKAKNLLDRIKKALSKKELNSQDKYYKEIRTVTSSLEAFLEQSASKHIPIKETQLNGLEGIIKKNCGCHSLSGIEVADAEEVENVVPSKGVMTVAEARSAQYRPVALTGEWLKLIGKMCLPTHFLVYGFGGSGKTSFVLLFTQYLSSLGYKILYVAREQFDTPTFTELLNRLNIVVGDNFQIVKDLNVLNPKNFDFVVLDSKDDMELELDNFVELKENYPNQSFIMISQGTKKGDFTGTGRWRNVVDVMILADNGIIKTGMDKNRWGGAGEIKII